MTKDDVRNRLAEESRRHNGDDIKILERQYLERPGSAEKKFQLAWGLVKSPNKDDIRRGVTLFRELVLEGYNERDSLYFQAEGHFKLQEYLEASQCLDRLLELDPACRQAIDLRDLNSDAIQKDGLIGMAIVGSVVVAGGVIASDYLGP
eukprot:CAMPEP_0184671394 /NCGR_PEP_ID=MMETSP0308-20130426/85470_1 /TAXON_ID=38269 /ORGANISM="Gloeochaete witrockiana, Strain SAG 46.84" /LENGTH=148 /DNA_ID=CAMNT_0027118505 /DNA_START=64 /DNA_END=511 /DNA_ORIENTATION=+